MNAIAQKVVADKRALLAAVADRKVRLLAAESNEYSAALFAVVRQRQVHFEFREWEAALDEIDTTELTVGEWLEAEARR